MMQSQITHPQKIIWCYIPIFMLIFWLLIQFTAPHEWLNSAVTEGGFLENAQVLVILIAIIITIYKLVIIDRRNHKLVAFALGSFFLGCFYILGEEISWGQWLFFWETPEPWSKLNDQNETNIHNISSWFDQKPRMLIEAGIIVGGIILPYILKRHSQMIPENLSVFIPSSYAAITSLIYIFVKTSGLIAHHFEIRLFTRNSEVTEFFIYYFLTAYIIDFRTDKFSRK